MPTYEYKYFYTVQVETDFGSQNEINSTGSFGDLALETQFGEFARTHLEQKFGSEVTYDEYGVYTGPASMAGPYATQIHATKSNNFRYTLRFYLQKKNTGDNTFVYYWLNEASVKNVKITAPSTTIKVGDVKIDKKADRGYSGLTSVQATSPNSDTENQSVNFWFTYSPTTVGPSTWDPPFTVTADIFPDKIAYRPTPGAVRIAVDTESPAYSGLITLAGVNPKILLRQGRTVPTVPPEFKTRLTARTGAFNTTDTTKFTYQYVYDICNKLWIGYKSGVKSGTSDKIVFTYLTSTIDGKTITESTLDSGTIKNNRPPVNLSQMAKKLYDAQFGQCGDKLDTNPANDPEKPAQVFPPTDAQRWNPPPHIASKGIPYSVRAGVALDSTGQPFNADEFRQLNSVYSFTGDDGRLERGRIFQDKLSAEVMNKSALSVGTGKKPSVKSWGFRFMYNPEIIGYGTTGNNSIDWTFGSKDSASLLTGNQNVKVELLLNRLSDLSYLKMKAANRDETAAYGRPLQDEERYGLLNRGTEYDLEFLYRVLNGDPEENTMLLDENYGASIGHKEYRRSSDIGYITAIPVWMYLGTNLRYFGSVSSIEVTHKIFDLNMVPMLSVVSIGFTRYPAAFNVAGETGLEAIGIHPKEATSNTPTTPTP